MAENQLWGGRFEKSLHPEAFALGQSIQLDIRLLPYDVRQSLSYLKALTRCGIVEESLSRKLESELLRIQNEYMTGALVFSSTDEDVHGLVERLLITAIGPEASIIRTGRSRNDQVATDLKLFLREHSEELISELISLVQVLAHRSEELVEVVASSYTHTQHAQPIMFAQELLKHGYACERSIGRLRDWQVRHSSMPLGSGAVAGSALPLDFDQICKDLGFSSVSSNSIDATSSRDFVTEFLFIVAQIAVDLSKIAEEIILWSTKEFGFINLPDEYSTGSSLMPQKRNPDFAELTRGKTGRMIANLVNVLTMLKALPFGYNRDLQEDKFPVFDSVDNIHLVLKVMTGLFSLVEFDVEAIKASSRSGHILATDIAEWLVERGIPYKEAHEIVGRLVKVAEDKGCDVSDLSVSECREIHAIFNVDVTNILDSLASAQRRTSPGSANSNSLRQQIQYLLQI